MKRDTLNDYETEAERMSSGFDLTEDEMAFGSDDGLAIETMREAYSKAKAAKTWEKIICPVCGKVVVKKSYQQAFCCNSGRMNCKDRYWNLTDEKRLERAKEFVGE